MQTKKSKQTKRCKKFTLASLHSPPCIQELWNFFFILFIKKEQKHIFAGEINKKASIVQLALLKGRGIENLLICLYAWLDCCRTWKPDGVSLRCFFGGRGTRSNLFWLFAKQYICSKWYHSRTLFQNSSRPSGQWDAKAGGNGCRWPLGCWGTAWRRQSCPCWSWRRGCRCRKPSTGRSACRGGDAVPHMGCGGRVHAPSVIPSNGKKNTWKHNDKCMDMLNPHSNWKHPPPLGFPAQIKTTPTPQGGREHSTEISQNAKKTCNICPKTGATPGAWHASWLHRTTVAFHSVRFTWAPMNDQRFTAWHP